MRSVALKGPKEFEIKEIEEPKSVDGSVVIDVKKTGICGSDIHYWVAGGPVGLVMGHEFCGVVTNPGSRTDLKVGDRITGLPISPCGHCPACLSGNPQYCQDTWSKAVGLSLVDSGGYAPKLYVRPDMVYKVPDGMQDEEAAMVEPAAVALHAVHLADIKIGAKVLIIGGGIIGLLSAEFAKMAGASYIALTEANNLRGENSIKFGAVNEWFDAKNEQLVPSLVSKTSGGFDVVLDCCGNAACVTSAITLVRPGGKVVLVGVSLVPITIPTVMAVLKEVDLQGVIAYTKEEFKTCIDLIASKKLNVIKYVSDIVGLDGVQQAFERLTSGNDAAVKILVDPNK